MIRLSYFNNNVIKILLLLLLNTVFAEEGIREVRTSTNIWKFSALHCPTNCLRKESSDH